MFEEADGLWINLQGKDREERIDNQKEKCEKENKEYIVGIMKPKELKELRDARVYQKYDASNIKLRVMNGDGAKWTKGITAKGGIYQKDQFHIMQEKTRDVAKENRNIIEELIKTKQYKKIHKAIEKLKYEVGGDESI